MDALSAANEIVCAAESSAAAMRKKPDEMSAADNEKEAFLHEKLGKGTQALVLLNEKLKALESQVTVKPLSRGSRHNPSRRF
jgi:hypothetical protein